MAHGGNLLHALLSQQEMSNSWIVDSGASDHMTGNMEFFKSLSTCTDSHTVRIANGSCSMVARYGTITLTSNIYLSSVLFVPDLKCNLLPVSKLVQDLRCTANFLNVSCVFQDSTSGKTIDSADLCVRLHLLKIDVSKRSLTKSTSNPLLSCSASVLNSNKDSEILL